MVTNVESFNMKSARSFLGRNVNLHLKDGSVIVNVRLGSIREDGLNRQKLVTCTAHNRQIPLSVPLKCIKWAEPLILYIV